MFPPPREHVRPFQGEEERKKKQRQAMFVSLHQTLESSKANLLPFVPDDESPLC
jgi:hypothetical protein